MQLKSETFKSDQLRWTGKITKERFLWWTWDREECVWTTAAEARKEAEEFASKIGKEKLYSITDSVKSNHVNGGLDGSWTNHCHIYTVWYWE